MACLHKSVVVGATIGMVVLSLVCQTALGRDVKLVICPQKISTEAGKYALLPSQALLTDGDAVSWYEKAVKALPDKKIYDQVMQYLKMPIDRMPADEVEGVLKQHVESLKCVVQAVKCRDCRWPARDLDTIMAKLPEYRRLAYVVRLWARYEIAQENYEGAVLAMQTGLGMSRHLMQGSTLVEFMVGQGTTAMMCTEVEEFVQAGEAPSLYAALAALPKPFADVERVIDIENKAMPSEPPAGEVARKLFEMTLKSRAQSDIKTRAWAKRLDRDLALWQCLEAIRSYAGAHGGQLPQVLADIKDASLPKDPVTGDAFRYTRTGATAVLESPAPAGGDEKDAVRYEIVVKN